jgi:hypothetical protein
LARDKASLARSFTPTMTINRPASMSAASEPASDINGIKPP